MCPLQWLLLLAGSESVCPVSCSSKYVRIIGTTTKASAEFLWASNNWFTFIMQCENCLKAKRDITNLKEDIWWLSDELRLKETLLFDCIDSTATQCKTLRVMNSVILDTIHPPNSPSFNSPLTSCLVGGDSQIWLDSILQPASPRSINLSVGFAVLQTDATAHPAYSGKMSVLCSFSKLSHIFHCGQ